MWLLDMLRRHLNCCSTYMQVLDTARRHFNCSGGTEGGGGLNGLSLEGSLSPSPSPSPLTLTLTHRIGDRLEYSRLAPIDTRRAT